MIYRNTAIYRHRIVIDVTLRHITNDMPSKHYLIQNENRMILLMFQLHIKRRWYTPSINLLSHVIRITLSPINIGVFRLQKKHLIFDLKISSREFKHLTSTYTLDLRLYFHTAGRKFTSEFNAVSYRWWLIVKTTPLGIKQIFLDQCIMG